MRRADDKSRDWIKSGGGGGGGGGGEFLKFKDALLKDHTGGRGRVFKV